MTDRHTDRHIHTQIYIPTDTAAATYIHHADTDKHIDKHTDTHTDRQTARHIQGDRDTESQTYIQRAHTYRQTDADND